MVSKADEKLDKLGFRLVKEDYECGIWLYENDEADQRVDIEFELDGWTIHSESINKYIDIHGYYHSYPIGLTYEECKAFLDKIDELKKCERVIREIYKHYYERKVDNQYQSHNWEK